MEKIKVCLRKKNAYMLERNESGVWSIDGNVIDQEQAIKELVEAVEDLGYWCQVAKVVLPKKWYEGVQESYEYVES